MDNSIRMKTGIRHAGRWVAPLWIGTLVISCAFATEPVALVYVPNSTHRICQLTGDVDRVTRKPTLSKTHERFGVEATDLGSSFEHKGKLYFLFGDTWGAPGLRDAMAWTNATDPHKILLQFPKGKNQKWLPLRRETEWGGEYGPYLMSRFTTASEGKVSIFYTMSTWNPYQVVVMQSDLALAPAK